MRTRTVEASVSITGELEVSERFTAYLDRGRRRRPVQVDTVTVTLPRGHVSGRGRKVYDDGRLSGRRVAVVPLAITDLPASVVETVEDQWRMAVQRLPLEVSLS